MAVERTAEGLALGFDGTTASYYQVWAKNSLTGQWALVRGVMLGEDGTQTWVDATAELEHESLYYRVRQIPVETPCDADNDGMDDVFELRIAGLDPLDPNDAGEDWDNDDLPNVDEYHYGSSLTNSDSDADGLPDGWEATNGGNPAVYSDIMADPDGDGIGNYYEHDRGTSGTDPASVPAPSLYVDPSAPSGGDGSQSAPFNTIQAAIEAAGDLAIIELGSGTYRGVGNRDVSFQGKRAVVKAGGPRGSCVVDCEKAGRGSVFSSGETVLTEIQGVTIRNGVSDAGGGIVCLSAGPTIRRCVIEHCSGGGVYCASPTNAVGPALEDCVLRGNSSGRTGGGLYTSNATVRLSRCLLVQNRTRCGGAFYEHSANSILENCTIVENSVWQPDARIPPFDGFGGMGGGIATVSSTPRIVNCTIANNAARNTFGSAGQGGGVYADGASPEILNTILWTNFPNSIQGGSPSVTYCAVMGGWGGEGNISSDPRLSRGCYRLDTNSPCIDAGSASGAPATDREGKGRSNHPLRPDSPSIVDIGAWECACDDLHFDFEEPTNAWPWECHWIPVHFCYYATNVAYSGVASLGFRASVRYDNHHYEAAVIDLVEYPQPAVSAPLNLEGKTLRAYLFCPPGSANEGGVSHNQAEIFAADSDLQSFHGTAAPMEDNEWIELTATLCSSGTFDATSVRKLGILINPSYGSMYSGPLYLDHFHIVPTNNPGDLEDTDADGAPSVYEFMHGTDPDDGASVPPVSWHVDAAAPTGGVGSAASPFDTFSDAIGASTAYDIIRAADGVYTGEYNRSLSPGKPIMLFSEHGATSCVIDCQNSGYGLYFYGGGCSRAVARGLTIRNGNASGGAGLYIFRCGPVIEDCIIEGCTASNMGAGAYLDCQNVPVEWDGLYPVIRRCTFRGNQVLPDKYYGGGICINFCNPTIEDCLIQSNRAVSGGGMSFRQCHSGVFRNCRIEGNQAYSCGGGLRIEESSVPLHNGLLVGNSALTNGGAIYHIHGSGSLRNCTVADNTAPEAGAIYAWEAGGISGYNSIFWGNGVTSFINGTSYVSNGLPSISNSAVEGGWEGEGNTNANPMFVSNTYELSWASPCIDAGGPDALPADWDGQARWDEPSHPNLYSIVDMGADEYCDIQHGFETNKEGFVLDYGSSAYVGMTQTTERAHTGRGSLRLDLDLVAGSQCGIARFADPMNLEGKILRMYVYCPTGASGQPSYYSNMLRITAKDSDWTMVFSPTFYIEENTWMELTMT
ncbi:MAG: right-handed parallel beta-helix repeat-containing protein, partial [Kiritimatiellae bacterium]|nr:right-handed parallel beta-helix repeat-containing protein [Kiritimatiellia bacterium]